MIADIKMTKSRAKTYGRAFGVEHAECASETDGTEELSRLADERKRRKEKNACALFSISESLRDSSSGARAVVNVASGGRNDGRFYRRGTERRAVLERIRSNRFSRGSTVDRAGLPLALRFRAKGFCDFLLTMLLRYLDVVA